MAVKISRQNQQLIFSVALIIVLGLVITHLVEKGMGRMGEKERVLALGGALAQCAGREDYLALLEKNYPPRSAVWQSPAMSALDDSTTLPAQLDRLPDGRLKVTVFAMSPARLLDPRNYVYLPAALVDENTHGYRLLDLRLNSRRTDLVFEYYYAGETEKGGAKVKSFRFYLGRHQWEMEPGVSKASRSAP